MITRVIRFDSRAGYRRYVFLDRQHFMYVRTYLSTYLSTYEERRLPVMQFHVVGREQSSACLQIYAFLLPSPSASRCCTPASGDRIMPYEKHLVWKCNITGDIGTGMRFHVRIRGMETSPCLSKWKLNSRCRFSRAHIRIVSASVTVAAFFFWWLMRTKIEWAIVWFY